MTRSYRVEHHIDHRPESPFHWRLYTYGPGHWCVSRGHSGSFSTEAEAEQAGAEWVRTGRPPCEQKELHSA